MELLDGRIVKKCILEELKQELLELPRPLGLTVVQVGEDPASKVYVKQKANMAEILGYKFNHVKLRDDISEEDLLMIIDILNEDSSIDGILVQMPLPSHIDAKVIQNRINPYKDVDGLSDFNAGKLFHGNDTLIPCTPYGILDLLNYYSIEISGKVVVVVGRSDLVGKPISSLMLNNNATVIMCHSKTRNMRELTRLADILIVAIGSPNFITEEDIKEGAVIIDVGINRIDDKLVGDVDFESVKDKVSYITPVPGGVGQMTVAELGKNVLKAYRLKNSR